MRWVLCNRALMVLVKKAVLCSRAVGFSGRYVACKVFPGVGKQTLRRVSFGGFV